MAHRYFFLVASWLITAMAFICSQRIAIPQEAAAEKRPLIPSAEMPTFVLRGQIAIPPDIKSRDVRCELSELLNAPFCSRVTPIQLDDQLEFEVRTQSIENAIVIRASSTDDRFQGTWQCIDFQLHNRAEEKITIELKPAVRFAFQVRHEEAPVADATVLVQGELALYSARSNSDGLAEIWTPSGERPWHMVAFDRKYLVAEEWRLPSDPSKYQPAYRVDLQAWEEHKIQVVGIDGSPVPNLRVSSAPGIQSDEKLIHEKFKEAVGFQGLTDEHGVIPSLFVPTDRDPSVGLLDSRYRIVANHILVSDSLVVTSTQANVEIYGKLELPSGIPGGLLLEGASFQNEIPNRSSIFKTRINADGTFRASVHPDYTYQLFVDDEVWVCQPWSGILARSDGLPADIPQLEIKKGEMVEVVATKGTDFIPEPNTWVQFESKFPFSYTHNGEKRSAMGGRRWSRKTDENGTVVTRAREGSLRVYINDRPWRAEQNVTVVPNQINVVPFHRELDKKLPFQGKLVPKNDQVQLQAWDRYRVVLKTERSYGQETELAVDNDGSFRGEADFHRLALIASSIDGKQSGFVVAELSDLNEKSLIISIQNSISIKGQCLDADGFPVVGAEVQMEARPAIAWKPREKERDFVYLGTIFSKTGKQGQYSFRSLPSDAPISGFLSLPDSENAKTLAFRHVPASGIRWRLPTLVLEMQDCLTLIPIAERVERRVDSAKLMNTNVLWIACGSNTKNMNLAKSLIKPRSDSIARHLLPIVIDSNRLTNDQGLQQWMKKQDWPIPSENEIALLVLNHQSEKILQQFVKTDGDVSSLSEILDETMLQLRPDTWDAESKLEAAFALAKKTNRDVWVTRSDPRSSVSIAIRRWQEEHRSVLEKAFVLISLELIRDSYSENFFDLPHPSNNVVLNPFGRVVWYEQNSSHLRDELKYSAIDPEVLKPLLESAASTPLDSETISKLID